MWGDVLCRGSGGQKSPNGIQGRSPVGGLADEEAEAILDFCIHNFDRILNYFCFARATEIRLTLRIREKYRENVKISGTLYIGVPPLQILGRVSPRPPKDYASAHDPMSS